MDDKKINKSETEKSKGILDNPFIIFFFGPFIFLLLVKFTGYQIFYNGDPNSKERMKSVWLLSLGTLFYVLVTVTLILTND